MTGNRIGEWIYFCPKEITVRDLYHIFEEQYDVEIWEDAEMLKILIGEKSSFDVESAEIHPKDTVTKAFVDERGIKTVFLVTFMPKDYEEAEVLMKQVLAKYAGVFCGDTEDFMPQLC